MKIVDIKNYNSEPEAQLAKQFLEENGIQSIVSGTDFLYHSGVAPKGIGIQVKEDEAEKALKILKDLENKSK